ncbi:hypothetical protein MBLNU459_g4269t1 [Dothideomycetes sp. NU459]
MVAEKKKSAGATRGGIAKRRSAARTDKDGDLVMDSSSRGGRGGISKARGTSHAGRGKTSKPARAAVNSDAFQRQVLRHVASGEASTRSSKTNSHRPLEELRITGWTSSKAASNSDGGLSSLITWLEKKATLKSPSKKPVKIKKSRVEGDDLLLSVHGEDVAPIIRVNGFVFAGANIKIERASAQDLTAPAPGSDKESTVAMLKGVLERRYNPEMKLLDLSALGQDADLKASQIFDSRSTTSKFFPALMKVLEQQFKSNKEKDDAILSVTLANNELPNISAVTTLSQTLSQLKNLDLSNNAFADLTAIEAWRRRFSKLDHLVITGNPLEQAEPDYASKLLAWYPRLRILNGQQVRSDVDADKGFMATDLPFPIKPASFQDEGQIAENFLRTFFAGFDSDRAALAQHYYDDNSDFSLSVNTQAPRDPSSAAKTEPQEWDLYIKRSRNLKKIQQLPARQSRHFRGPKAIHDCWSTLPTTRHPDLATEASKWLIECQSQPGVPDPTGASQVGVDGFLITIHGQYDEMDVSTGQVKKVRSFDRSFILGPGGPTGVRVVNDMLTVRAYGGSQAFEPEEVHQQQQQQPESSAPGLPPAGLTPEVAEQMVLELQKQTGMTVAYAKDCLDQVAWEFERALQAFAAVRAALPPEAFTQPQQP